MSIKTTFEESPSTLLREVQVLSNLLQRYREDLSFVNERSSARIVYFIDSHDLNSYINPDNPRALDGFRFEAEWDFSRDENEQKLELQLKSDQILRRLLFDSDAQIGLFPSHGEEVDAEVAFQHASAVRSTFSLLQQALVQAHSIQHRTLASAIVSPAVLNDTAATGTRLSVVKFVEQASPALLTLMRPSTNDSALSRAAALIADSGLVGLGDFRWETLGLSRIQANQLRAVQPSSELVQSWHEHLLSRRRHSNRANRIDGQALACIQTLNDTLAAMSDNSIRVLLVTRAIALHDAAGREEVVRSGLGGAAFLRHPRTLLVQNAESGAVTDDVIQTLAVALETLGQQLNAQELDSAQLQEAREIFSKAWRKFEQTRFMFDLRASSDHLHENNPLKHEGDLKRIVEWFANDAESVQLIVSRLRDSVRVFGRATYSLSQDKYDDQIEARLVHLEDPTRTSLRPLIAGVPGPVEFIAPALQEAPEHIDDLVVFLKNISASSAEQYLAWALLHACRERWQLAAIYARSASDVVHLLPPTEATRVRREAWLLWAQVKRLGEMTSVDEHGRRSESIRRYKEVNKQLHFFNEARDVRVLHEGAAQIIELALIVGERAVQGERLVDGLLLLNRALELSAADKVMQMRLLAMKLIYVVAVLRRGYTWPEDFGDPLTEARQWHIQLQTLLKEEANVSEVPHRVRAMEIIGFMFRTADQYGASIDSLARHPPLIPRGQRVFALELHEQIRRSHDQTAMLIVEELDKIRARVMRNWQRQLIYAPIWAPYDGARFSALMPDSSARESVLKGYQIIAEVAGEKQLGVDARHRGLYRRAAALFEAAVLRFKSVAPAGGNSLTLFRLWMAWCYARLLLALVTVNSADKATELCKVSDEYEQIASQFPLAAAPHLRRYLIFQELLSSTADADSQWENLAAVALANVVAKIDSDPTLRDFPEHWVRSIVTRLHAHAIAAPVLLRRIELSDAEKGVHLLPNYLRDVRRAFSLVFESYRTYPLPPKDEFYRLEGVRRVDSILFYATRYLEVSPEFFALDSQFTKEIFRNLLGTLHPMGIEKVADPDIVHTIGCAYYLLDEPEKASLAGSRFIELLIDSGADPNNDENLVRLISEAFRWRQANLGPLVYNTSSTVDAVAEISG